MNIIDIYIYYGYTAVVLTAMIDHIWFKIAKSLPALLGQIL